MKKHHILIVIVMAVCIGIIISSTSSGNEYADFYYASQHEDKEFAIIGNLNKSKPINYNPGIDPNLVSFYMVDKKGKELNVILNQSLPQDLEKSEDMVVKRKVHGQCFLCKYGFA